MCSGNNAAPPCGSPSPSFLANCHLHKSFWPLSATSTNLLGGRRFSLLTDHKPLTTALYHSSQQWSAHQQHQLAYLHKFDTVFLHILGAPNTARLLIFFPVLLLALCCPSFCCCQHHLPTLSSTLQLWLLCRPLAVRSSSSNPLTTSNCRDFIPMAFKCSATCLLLCHACLCRYPCCRKSSGLFTGWPIQADDPLCTSCPPSLSGTV